MALGLSPRSRAGAAAPRRGRSSRLLEAASHLRSLTRLRLAFVALAVALLVPLALLLDAAGERVEQQRRLRHQMVSERIFDELERELTALLEREAARPSQAYDHRSSPEAWAPFVVSYFVADRYGERPASSAQLDPERRSALENALSRWRVLQEGTKKRERIPSQNNLQRRPAVTEQDSAQQSSTLTRPPAPAAAPLLDLGETAAQRDKAAKRTAPKSSPEVLRQLNRAQTTRRRAAPARPAREADPLKDYNAY